MTYQAAVAELETIRHSGNLERVRQVIEAYDREAGGSDFWESSRLLLQACDVLNSHDFGDHKGQMDLIRTYARRALVRSVYTSVEQELRLLSHLHHDFEEAAPIELWRRNRLTRARQWLRALQVLSDATRYLDVRDLPNMKTASPLRNLPSGVAAEHVTDGTLRGRYRSSVDRNRQESDEFALQWQLRRLRRVYEPLAAKYITSAYAQEPHDLGELKQLLNEYSIHDLEPPLGPELTDETVTTTEGGGLISQTASESDLPPRLGTSQRDSIRSEGPRASRRKPAARRSESRKPQK
jgi:hypothetical protein